MTRPADGLPPDLPDPLLLLRELPDAVVVIDGDGRLVWGNDAAEAFFGMDVATGRGISGFDLVHPADLPMALTSLASVQGKEVGSPLELRMRAARGWTLVEMIGRPLGNHILLTMRDLTERRRWEVADRTELFRAILNHVAVVTLLADPEGRIVRSSPVAVRVLGLDPEELEGTPVAALAADEAGRRRMEKAYSDLHAGAPQMVVDLAIRCADGGALGMSATLSNLLDDPVVGGVVVTLHDISDRLQAEAELREASELLATTLDATAEGVLVLDLDGTVVHANRRLLEMWRLDPACVSEVSLDVLAGDLSDPNEFIRTIRDLTAASEAESHDVVEFRDGRVVERDSRPRVIDGRVIGRVWCFRDVTAHRVLQRELARQASHDPLTGLANQMLFRQRAERAVARHGRRRNRVAVVFVDLDDFKTINDSLGHPAGDHLLVAVADRLRAAVRAEDLVARLGGDEFAILLEGVTEEHAMDVARRILALAAEPVMVGDREVRAGASVGVAFARDGDGPDELLRNADLAMYVAKRSGRGCHRVYVDDMHDAALRRLEVDSELRGAAAKGELEVHYQPVVHLVDGTLTGFEALVRWRHPTRGLLAPGEFLPIAEETGSVDEVGWYVLERACGEASSWPAGPSGADLPVTVNLAVRQLLDDHLPERIARLLDGVGLDPGRLVLEVTEGGLMQDPEAMTRRLSALHGLGVRLAIDDFGTGYSSLAQLRRFPVDVLKLDRLFVLGVEDADGRAVARAVVELAGALGLEAVAEGVETAGQRSALLDLGCVLAQGHLFAAALPPGEVEALIGAGGVVLDGAAGVVAGLA